MPTTHHMPQHFEHSGYRAEYSRGSSLLQLRAVKLALNNEPWLRNHWHEATFTPEVIGNESFDALTRNIAYHFHTHGQSFGTVRLLTEEALRYWNNSDGGDEITLRDSTPGIRRAQGIYTPDGRIVTYFGPNGS